MFLVRSGGNVTTGRMFFGPFGPGDVVRSAAFFLPSSDYGDGDVLLAAVSVGAFSAVPADTDNGFAEGRSLIPDVAGAAFPFVYCPVHPVRWAAAEAQGAAPGGWFSVPLMWEASDFYRVLGLRMTAAGFSFYANAALDVVPFRRGGWAS